MTIPRHTHRTTVTKEDGYIARNGELVTLKIQNKKFLFCDLCQAVPTSEIYIPPPEPPVDPNPPPDDVPLDPMT